MTKDPLLANPHLRTNINRWLRHFGKPVLTDHEFDKWQAEADVFESKEIAQRVVDDRRRLRPIKMADSAEPAVIHRWIEARSMILAARAERDVDVIAFRQQQLGGLLIDPEEMGPWLEAHNSPDRRFHVTVVAPAGWDGKTAFTVDPKDYPYSGLVSSMVSFPGGGGYQQSIVVGVGSMLDQLRALSESLARRFQWQPAQAVQFVLCGGVPIVQVLRMTMATVNGGPDKVVIEADPDVPVEAVAAAFVKARRSLIGARARLPSAKSLDLLIMSEENPRWTSGKLLERWNEAHPSAAYENPRALAQALRDARRRVLGEPKRALSGLPALFP